MRPEPLSPEPESTPIAEPRVPATTPASVAAEPPWHGARRWSRGALLAALIGILMIPIGAELQLVGLLLLGLLVMVVGSIVGAIAAGVALVKMWRAPEPVPTRTKVGAWASLFGGAFFFFGSVLVILASMMFSRGRQLRRRGKVLLPEVAPGGDWAHLRLGATVPDDLRVALASQWRENGRTEHASVAAFAKLTLELIALGAPPRLLHDAQGDAVDEIRHAELCFSLARGLDGDARSPAPFAPPTRARRWLPLRTFALARLAVDSLVDGALHEGLSARVIAKLVPRCEVPEIRAVLKELAADEGKHCAHGWDVVEWCLEAGGWPVAQALRGAIRRLPSSWNVSSAGPSAAGEWERFGIPGHALEAQEYARARAELIRRLEPLCAVTVPAASGC